MASTDRTVKIKNLVLRAGRFGEPTRKTLPYGGVLGTTHHNVATAIYPQGTVLQLWNSSTPTVPGSAATIGSEGWSEFVYGRLDSPAGDPTAAARQVCLPVVVTEIFDFTNDPADATLSGFSVVSISAMTNNYYGWFWSGGVCPTHLVTTDFAVSSAIAAVSAAIAAGNSVQASALSADALGLAITDGTTPPIGSVMVAPA